MDALTRPRFLVADRSAFPSRQSGRLVDMGEQRHPISGQDTFDCGAGDAEVATQTVWPHLRVNMSEMMRCSRPFGSLIGDEWGRDERPVSSSPEWCPAAHFDAVAGASLEALCNPSDRPTIIDDEFRKKRATRTWAKGSLAWDTKTFGGLCLPTTCRRFSPISSIHNAPRNYN